MLWWLSCPTVTCLCKLSYWIFSWCVLNYYTSTVQGALMSKILSPLRYIMVDSDNNSSEWGVIVSVVGYIFKWFTGREKEHITSFYVNIVLRPHQHTTEATVIWTTTAQLIYNVLVVITTDVWRLGEGVGGKGGVEGVGVGCESRGNGMLQWIGLLDQWSWLQELRAVGGWHSEAWPSLPPLSLSHIFTVIMLLRNRISTQSVFC